MRPPNGGFPHKYGWSTLAKDSSASACYLCYMTNYHHLSHLPQHTLTAHSFCMSGIWAWLSWVPCTGPLMRLQLGGWPGLGSHVKAQPGKHLLSGSLIRWLAGSRDGLGLLDWEPLGQKPHAGPCQWAPQHDNLLHQSQRGRESANKREVRIFCNLINGTASPQCCQILLARSKLLKRGD